MQILTPETTIQWITKLRQIEEACHFIINKSDPGVPIDIWQKTLNAKITAKMLREDLTALIASPLEVAST